MTRVILGKLKINRNTIYLMNKFLSTRDQNFNNQLSYFLEIRKKNSESKESIVRKIVKDIRKNQDVSLIKYEKKFSGIKKLNKKNLFFSKSELKKSLRTLSRKTKKDIDLAYNRILNFHKNQIMSLFLWRHPMIPR